MSDESHRSPAELSALQRRVLDLERLLAQVERQERFLSIAAELAHVGGWELDLDTMTPRWSRETCAIHEVPHDYQPTLQSALEFYQEGPIRESKERLVRESIARGAPWDTESQLVTAKGRRLWVRTLGRPVFREGRCVRYVGIIQDITVERRIREALRESEERYRLLFEESADAIFLVEIDPPEAGRIVAANRMAGVMHGCTAEELIGRMISELDAREDAARASERISEIRRTGSLRFEVRHRLPDGSEREFDVSASRIEIAGRAYCLSVNRDITDLKRVQAAVSESEERFRTLTNAASVLIWMCDRTGALTYVNDSWVRFTGVPREASLGDGWKPLIHPDDLDELVREFLAAVAERRNYTLNYRLRFLEEGFRWVQETAVPRFSAAGEYQGLIGCCTDIHDRMTAEEELREAEARQRALGDNVPDGVVYRLRQAAPGGPVQLLYVSAGIERLLGISREEAMSAPGAVRALIHPDDRTRVDEAERRSFESMTTFECEYRHLTKSGDTIWVQARSAPRPGADGSVVWEGILLDQTQRRHAEEQRLKIELKMQQAQRLESLGVLAGGIAHDFNNLLAAILGNAELLELELQRTIGRVPDALGDVVKASQRAGDLCRQLLAYAGHTASIRKPVELARLVAGMASLLEVSTSRRATLSLDCAEDTPLIDGDPAALHQVAMNLIINAAEAAPPTGGRISVRVGARRLERHGDPQVLPPRGLEPGLYAELVVTDNGCGMDSGTLARIFDPFFSTKFTGRGLGLASVLGIVRTHGGGIAVQSQPGIGTTFTLSFPASESAAMPEHTPLPRTGFAGSGIALIIDDEPAILQTQARMIRVFGYETEEYSHPADALTAYAAAPERYALAFVDLVMPQMSGEQVLRALRNRRPELPTLLVTGLPDAALRERLSADPALAWIEKPFQLATLEAVLSGLMRNLSAEPDDKR